MKRVKTVILTLIFIIVGTVLVSHGQAVAASKADVPASVHISAGNQVGYACDIIRVSFAKNKDHIKNVKTSSKSLHAEVTNILRDSYNNLAEIGLYAEKKGTYKVSFDIYNAKNKKVSSHSVKVYAYAESPVKSISYGGADMTHGTCYTELPSGKLSVTMNNGYKIKEIRVITFNKKGELVTKFAENNEVIEISKYPEFRESQWGNNYSMNSSGVPYTQIYITYMDKYTKKDVELDPYKIVLWE